MTKVGEERERLSPPFYSGVGGVGVGVTHTTSVVRIVVKIRTWG